MHCVHNENLLSISALQEKILRDPEMMKKLFTTLSINVTEMFRDPTFFQSFRKIVIPIVREYPDIRIWHVGCATGEEVYSMAILLYEEGIYEKTRFMQPISTRRFRKSKTGAFSLDGMQQYTKNYIEAGGSRPFSEYYKAVGDQVFPPFSSKKYSVCRA